MAIKVMLFGQLAGLAGKSSLEIADAADTQTLQQVIHASFPGLACITYRIAVNRKIISENTTLTPETTIAFLPPFSGG